uniref:Uncharacterized protein n=1 Tax=Oryza nivara TaxID=4536 RepID=A0A0E0GH41_ORYNI
ETRRAQTEREKRRKRKAAKVGNPKSKERACLAAVAGDPQRHLRRHGRRRHLRRRARFAERQESVRIGQITRPFLPLRQLLRRVIPAEPIKQQIASTSGKL